jgi:hypothetical protein
MENYPRISEQGEKEAQALIESFKEKLKRVASDVLDDLYFDVGSYIESDSWTNFRNQFISAFRRLDEKFCGVYNLKDLARVIAEEHPEQIAKLVDQGNVEKIRSLEESVEYWRRAANREY